MEGYEFLAQLQRLTLVANMLETTDVDGVAEHLSYAETVAPLFDAELYAHGSARLADLRRFVAKAVEFKRECRSYQNQLAEAERIAAARRRKLVAGPPRGGLTAGGTES